MPIDRGRIFVDSTPDADVRLLPGRAALVVASRERLVAVTNELAPEHVAVQTSAPRELAAAIGQAGAIFVGHQTPEAAGDYLAGPSHVLPTGGAARYASPLGVYDFVSRSSVIEYGIEALRVQGEPIATFAAGIVWVKMIDVDSLDTIDREPVGTGPYVVDKFTPDDSLTLVPNENYFGDAPALDEITIVKAAESTAAVTGLRSGDIDVLWSVPQGDVAGLEAGGDIVVSDPPPGTKGWEVEIANSGQSASQTVPLANRAISTSGDTEQFVEIDGKRYSHVVDPRTGIGLTERYAATVIAPNGITSDALSTAATVLGAAEGTKVAKSYRGVKAYIRKVG